MDFRSVLSKKREAVPTPDNICDELGNCYFGTFDKEFALGIAYVPVQCWKGITCNETSLKNGTVFEELTKPFTGCERRRMHG